MRGLKTSTIGWRFKRIIKCERIMERFCLADLENWRP